MEKDRSLKVIVKGASVVFAGLLFSKLISYIYRIIVARIGTEEYGLLSLGLAIFGVLAVISIFGLQEGVLRYVSYYKAKENQQRIKGTILSALKITIPLSLILAFLLFIFSDWISLSIFHNIRLSIVLKVLALAIPLDVLRNIFFSTLKAYEKIEYEVYSKNIIENLVKLILTIALIYFGLGLMGATIAFTTGILVSFLLSIYFFEKKIYPLIKTKLETIHIGKELISYSWPLLISGTFHMIIFWTDTFMIGFFSNVSQVGLYNAAIPTAELIYVLPLALLSLFLPVWTNLYVQKNKEALKSVYKTITKWIFLINLPILALFILYSTPILNIIFGKLYLAAASVLVILAIGHFINSLMLPYNNILMVLKRTKLVLLNTAIAGILNIILNYFLIPAYGIIGAAIATSISLTIWAMLLLIQSLSISKLGPFKLNYFKIILSILITTMIFKYLIGILKIKYNIYTFILVALLFVILYVLLLYITKSFEEDDKIIIRAIKNKLNFLK